MSLKPNVLVVEDRHDWLDIISDTIAELGYHPHPVTSFAEAAGLLSKHQFALAVIDPVLDMANRFNRDGLSVIQKINQLQPDIPVVVLTGSLSQDLRASLHHLCPKASVLLKETWNPADFNALLQSLTSAPEKLPPNEVPAETTTTPVESIKTTAPSQTASRARVLVVEDRPDWQAIVTDVLDEAGYFWRLAADAQQALREIEQTSFHLVILDLKLQENELPLRSTEGWLLLDYLAESRPKTRVMILSGQASPGDVADLLTQYPIIRFVEKQTFSPQIITSVVAEATKSPALKIQTMGRFRLWRDGKPIEIWERPQAETLVKLLLTRRAREDRAVSADELIVRLWPDADELSGRKKLRPLISNARRTIEPDIEPRDSNFILRSSTGYFFEVGGSVQWDLPEFRQHLETGYRLMREEQWAEAIAELEAGRNIYHGDFLAEDRYADWAIELQREIGNAFRDLLIALADAYAKAEQLPNAINACEAALRKDPLQESVYRRLMRYHYCLGNKAQALKVHRDCQKIFEDLFGESPSPVTHQLQRAIANDEPVDCGA